MIKKTSLSALAAALVCSLLSFNANAEFAADGTGCAINGASDINVALDGSSFVDHGNVMVGTIIKIIVPNAANFPEKKLAVSTYGRKNNNVTNTSKATWNIAYANFRIHSHLLK